MTCFEILKILSIQGACRWLMHIVPVDAKVESLDHTSEQGSLNLKPFITYLWPGQSVEVTRIVTSLNN